MKILIELLSVFFKQINIKTFFLLLVIFFTGNINAQWIPLISNFPSNTNITNVGFQNYSSGFASTFNTIDSSGVIYRTVNGGLNWEISNFNVMPVRNVYLPNDTDVFAAGNTHIWISSNSGNNWIQKTFTNYEFYDIRFQNILSVYVCGYSRNQTRAAMIRSSNRGSTWGTTFLMDISFRFYSIRFPAFDTGYVCGDNGIIRKLIEGVTNWEPQSSGSNEKLYCLHFFNAKTGFAVGTNSTILRTTNGGLPWYSISTNFSNVTFKSISFSDVNTGFLVGSDGFIARSTDGGLTWSQQSSQTTSDLNGISFINNDTLYAGGNNGVFLRTYNSGYVTGVNVINSGPVDFYLLQNFPNPFNPVTYIKFNISKASNVNLVIYNSIGKEIELLLNKELPYGSYSIDWDASLYPSGVYFYKITAGEYSETKKMILLK